MKTRKTLISVLLIVALIISMSAVAFAADAPNIQPKVVKHLKIAEGTTVPDVTFHFNVEKVTQDAPDVAISDISYDSSLEKGTSQDGKYTIEKTSDIKFGTFTHAGEYIYRITEEQGTVEGMDYSKDTYEMRVYVNNDGQNLKISYITAAKGGVKHDKILFTNTYTKKGTLTIEKYVSGDLADKTKDFEFEITFATTTSGTLYEGMVGELTVLCVGGTPTHFTLSHGQKLVFDQLPTGTRYVVKELAAEDGYKPAFTLIENGKETVTNMEFDDSEAAVALAEGQETALVGEETNMVTFTNTEVGIVLTGLIMNNLPFILLIAIGGTALALIAVSKKRRSAER